MDEELWILFREYLTELEFQQFDLGEPIWLDWINFVHWTRDEARMLDHILIKKNNIPAGERLEDLLFRSEGIPYSVPYSESIRYLQTMLYLRTVAEDWSYLMISWE